MTVNKPEALVKALVSFFGREWLSWSPDVFVATLKSRFGYDPSDAEREKLEALREVLRDDKVLSNAFLFEKVVRAFNELPFTFEAWEPVEPAELAYGLQVIAHLTGEEDMDDLGEAVRAYIAYVLQEEGILYGAPQFYFDRAQDKLQSVTGTKDEDIRRMDALWSSVVEGIEPFKKFETVVRRIREKSMDEADRWTLVMLASVWAFLGTKEI